MPLPFLTCALLALTLTAAVTDVRSGLIPNWLTLPALVITPPLQLALGGTSALVSSLIGCAVCALVPLLLFRAGAMGGGDVKLLSVIGAVAGPLSGIELQLLAYNVLVAFALIALAHQGQLIATLRRSWALVVRRGAQQADASTLTSFRLGAPIFVATALRTALELAR